MNVCVDVEVELDVGVEVNVLVEVNVEVLVSVGVDVKVWVDTRKGYYYCPGDDQYGRTSRGTYMTQREAQADYYIPALMKPCP